MRYWRCPPAIDGVARPSVASHHAFRQRLCFPPLPSASRERHKIAYSLCDGPARLLLAMLFKLRPVSPPHTLLSKWRISIAFVFDQHDFSVVRGMRYLVVSPEERVCDPLSCVFFHRVRGCYNTLTDRYTVGRRSMLALLDSQEDVHTGGNTAVHGSWRRSTSYH